MEPTFPIPEEDVSRRRRQEILRTPLTRLIMGGAIGIPLIMGAPVLVALGIGALAGGGLWAYWWSRRGELDAYALKRLVADSNDAQDRELVNRSNQLARNGFRDYGVTLASFLRRKQQIERKLHASGDVTPQKEQVENLVDALCDGVADELDRLASLQGRKTPRSWNKGKLNPAREKIRTASNEIARRIQRAYDTLEETWHSLDEIVNPAVGLEQDAHSLDGVIDKLKEEREISRRVRKRLQEEMGFGESLDDALLGGDDEDGRESELE